MGTKNLLTLKAHLDLVIKRFFLNEFVYENMVQLMASVLGLLGFICNYVFYVFGVIFRFVFR